MKRLLRWLKRRTQPRLHSEALEALRLMRRVEEEAFRERKEITEVLRAAAEGKPAHFYFASPNGLIELAVIRADTLRKL